jgi:hypothetical protein
VGIPVAGVGVADGIPSVVAGDASDTVGTGVAVGVGVAGGAVGVGATVAIGVGSGVTAVGSGAFEHAEMETNMAAQRILFIIVAFVLEF